MTDMEFIKKFGTITVKSICEDLGVNKSNLYNGAISDKKVKMVKDELVKRMKELLQEEESKELADIASMIMNIANK